MDKLESVTPENSSRENTLSNAGHQQNGVGAVASLVSALLDDVTVIKTPVTQSQLAENHSQPVNANGTGAPTQEDYFSSARPPVLQSSTQQMPEINSFRAPASNSFDVSESEAPTSPVNGYLPIENRSANGVMDAEKTIAPVDSTPTMPVQSVSTTSDVGKTIREQTSSEQTTSEQITSEQTTAEPIANTKPSDVYLQPANGYSTMGSFPASSTSEPSAEQDANAEPYQSDGMAINIKGRADGVIIEIGRGNWEILVEALRKRLIQAGGFFRGGNAALDLADRSLQESDLRLICDVLVAHNMKPALVRTASDRTFQSALMLGLAGTLESMEGRPLETVHAAPSNQESQTHYVYRGALRSGQVLKRRSHILIIGDVNPGSEVIATGDILIWGRLRGSAHAGVEGDMRAMVAAFDIDPVQLRIADVVAVGNSTQTENGYRWVWSRNSEKRPEVARLVNGQITIEPWDEAKTGGAPVLKKRR